MNKPQDMEERFDEKYNEFNNDMEFDFNGDTEIHYFGYKHKTPQDYVFSIVDWGHVKSFIKDELHRQKEEIKGMIEGMRKDIDGLERGGEFYGLYDDLGFNRAINDILTKLEE